MRVAINPTTVLVATSDQVSTPVNDELVLLQLKNGKYYSLNRVGSLVWEHLKTPITIGALVDIVMERFDVERAQCEGDVTRLAVSLSDAGLVEVQG